MIRHIQDRVILTPVNINAIPMLSKMLGYKPNRGNI